MYYYVLLCYYSIGSSVDYQDSLLLRGFTFNTVFVALAPQQNWSDSTSLLLKMLYFFTPGSMITFRSDLLRAKLYSLEKTVGSCKCYGKRYEVCDVTETSAVTSTTTQNTHNICQFNCREKAFFIYLMQ